MNGNGKLNKILSSEHKEKLRMAATGRILDEETKRKISKSLKGRYFSKEHRRKLSTAAIGKIMSEEARIKNSESHIGRIMSESTKRKHKKNWKNSEYVKKQMSSRKRNVQNKTEAKFSDFLDLLFPKEWKWVGGGEVVFGGKVPDFINVNGQKKIIELAGDYWHDKFYPAERKRIFKKFGYDTLIIWTSELSNIEKIELKIKKFMEKTHE